MISKSKTGLRKCLDQLLNCERWQSTVNISKTKVMVLSAGTAQTKDVLFNGELLQCVPSYKYQGLIFSCNGNLGKMEEDKINKARKASYLIRQAISSSYNISTRLFLSLFDKMFLAYPPIWMSNMGTSIQ